MGQVVSRFLVGKSSDTRGYSRGVECYQEGNCQEIKIQFKGGLPILKPSLKEGRRH